MKRKQIIPTILCVAVILSLLLLTGCLNTPLTACPIENTGQAQDTNQTQDKSQAKMQQSTPTAPPQESQVESPITTPQLQPTPIASPPPPTPAPPPPPTPSHSTGGHESGHSHHAISLDRAIEIANADLANRGINATYRSNSGLDWERGQRVWELLFSTHGERMPLIEYYINADNGNIVKFEWDD